MQESLKSEASSCDLVDPLVELFDADLLCMTEEWIHRESCKQIVHLVQKRLYFVFWSALMQDHEPRIGRCDHAIDTELVIKLVYCLKVHRRCLPLHLINTVE